MRVSEGFELSSKIHFHYNRRLTHSIAINSEIAQALGKFLYIKFCDEIKNQRNKSNDLVIEKNFVKEFLENPVEEKDCMHDLEVCENYSFESIMKALAAIISQ